MHPTPRPGVDSTRMQLSYCDSLKSSAASMGPNIIYILCNDCVFRHFNKIHGVNPVKKQVMGGFCLLRSRVIWSIPVLCSHCIKMKICYSRISRNFLSEASIFPINGLPFIFDELGALMNSAPSAVWRTWEKGRFLTSLRIGHRNPQQEGKGQFH